MPAAGAAGGLGGSHIDATGQASSATSGALPAEQLFGAAGGESDDGACCEAFPGSGTQRSFTVLRPCNECT